MAQSVQAEILRQPGLGSHLLPGLGQAQRAGALRWLEYKVVSLAARLPGDDRLRLCGQSDDARLAGAPAGLVRRRW